MRFPEGAFVARAAARAYRAAGALAGFFLLLGVMATVENRGSWPVLAIGGGATVVMLANLPYSRLAVSADGIRYRSLRGIAAPDSATTFGDDT